MSNTVQDFANNGVMKGQVGHTVLSTGLEGTSTHFAHQHTVLSAGYGSASTHFAVI